jgi:hypothetical protein
MTNFSTPQGDTWQGLTIEFLIDSVAVNLTGASILMQLRKTFCDNTVALEFSTDDGSIVIDNPSTGHFSIEPIIISISPRQYVYDTQLTLASGRVITLLEGNFTVTPTVTR